MISSLSRRQMMIGSGAASLAALSGCATVPHGAAGIALPDWREADNLANSIRPPRIAEASFRPAATALSASDGRDRRPAIQAAIEEAAASGGGRVVLGEGLWFSDGPIHLRSGIELHLAKDAVLRFSGNAESYLPAVLTRWEGTDVYTYSPFIFATGCTDVALTGPGTIDGQGEANFLPWRETQNPIKNILRNMGRDGVPVEERVFVGERRLRPHFVQFHECERVLVDGVTLRDSPFWMIHPVYSRDVTIRNVTCVSRHVNSDGVDPDSSQRVLIEDCDFDVGDDGVAIKSGRDQDGWRRGIPSRNIVIRRCRYLGDTGGAVAIGSEMSGGVSNVWIEDWNLQQSSHALYFKANLDRGGRIADIHARNIVCGRTEAALIFTNDYHGYRGGNAPPEFTRVTVENMRVRQAKYGLAIQGHPDAPVRDVLVAGLVIDEVEVPLEAEDVRNIELVAVTMNGRAQNIADALPWSDGKSF